jgi:hypothetical protein
MKPLFLTEQAPDRRGFLRRLVAATGAATATHTLLLPARNLITPTEAADRLAHHLASAEAAFKDLYPQGEIFQWGNHNGEGDPDLRGRFASGALSGGLVLQFNTAPPPNVGGGIHEAVHKFMRERFLV